MNRHEVVAILKILKVSYPRFYANIEKEEATEIVNLWSTMFADNSAKIVTEAVKSLIATLKFPPTIADVKEKIKLLTEIESMTEIEAWNKVRQAISYYNAGKNFERLEPVLQRLVGSPQQLREWALMDNEAVQSVVQSNFMRSYKAKAKHEEEMKLIPESAKKLIDEVQQKARLIGSSKDGRM